jgi:hypothetical protein
MAAGKAVAFLVAPLLLGGLCGCTTPPQEDEEQAMTSDEEQAAVAGAVARRMGLALPPGADVRHAAELPGMDDAAQLLLLLSREEWETMIGPTPIAALAPTAYAESRVYHLGLDERGEWRSPPGEALKVAQLHWNEGREALNIGLADAPDGRLRVYLFWHQL